MTMKQEIKHNSDRNTETDGGLRQLKRHHHMSHEYLQLFDGWGRSSALNHTVTKIQNRPAANPSDHIVFIQMLPGHKKFNKTYLH